MAFTLFWRKFGNVVNCAFLVQNFLVKKFVGANFTRFCNYADGGEVWKSHILADKIFEFVLVFLTRYAGHNMVYYYGQMQLIGDCQCNRCVFFLASLDGQPCIGQIRYCIFS